MIGVVGPRARARDLLVALDDAEVVVGEAETVLAGGADVVVAVGEDAASALARSGVDVPVLPVEAGPGLDSVAPDRVPAVLRAGLDGGFHTRGHPVLDVTVDDDPAGEGEPTGEDEPTVEGETAGGGLFDATLVTSEPARISEFAVATAGWTEQFRADGVVVSTPAGSRGYGRAVGGPVLDLDATALSVVPVAAFALRSTVRVADADATLSISVERDEGDVSLLVDGRERRRVPARRTVTVRVGGTVETVLDPEG